MEGSLCAGLNYCFLIPSGNDTCSDWIIIQKSVKIRLFCVEQGLYHG